MSKTRDIHKKNDDDFEIEDSSSRSLQKIKNDKKDKEPADNEDVFDIT